MVTVNITTAVICFLGQCHPVLVGPHTPVGEYTLIQRITETPGYGGDVLEFYEDEKAIYAIHRVWTLKPAQHREQRIKSSNVNDRTGITMGCINVEPEVYKELVDCCSNDTLKIER